MNKVLATFKKRNWILWGWSTSVLGTVLALVSGPKWTLVSILMLTLAGLLALISVLIITLILVARAKSKFVNTDALAYIFKEFSKVKNIFLVVLPEETRAEMNVIYHRLKRSNLARWQAHFCLASEILFMYLGLIRIWWDNLFLPKADHEIDD